MDRERREVMTHGIETLEIRIGRNEDLDQGRDHDHPVGLRITIIEMAANEVSQEIVTPRTNEEESVS